ncbi:MAG: BatA domain-containing protein [Verrucomicrobia bacterium]|nr:BatA domain-containing protein [Verrucomicrobiota bacterium]
MSFLAPLFLLGALAVGLPILFHLIRRTTREKTLFSSLMFLLPTPPRVTKRSRLENIWLLILRCLVLLLLAFGFARPFLPNALAPSKPAGPGTKTIVLVDTSASMRRENLWAEAKAKAEELFKKAGPADEIALLTFDRTTQTRLSLEDWRKLKLDERAAAAAQRLAAVQPTWFATHLGPALIQAAELLDQPGQTNQTAGVRQIIVISDMQDGAKFDGLQGYEWPRGIQVSLETVKPKKPTNAGLQWVSEVEEGEAKSAGEPSAIRLRVVNSADSKRDQFKIRWTGAPEIESQEVYVPAGQSRIVKPPKQPDSRPDRLALTGDDADFDNSVHILPPQLQRLPLLFLGNDAETDPGQSLYYLKRAFQKSRNQVVDIIARRSDQPVAAFEMQSAQLLVLGENPTDAALTAARQFAKDGKFILAPLPSAASVAALAKLLELPSLSAEEARVKDYAMFAQIDFQHPLFAAFADPRYSDFTKIHFWKHRKLDAAKLPGARVIAKFDDGDPALVQVPLGKGAVVILTTTWRPADSQLALSSKFVPLLYALLEQSSDLPVQKAQYFTGDEVPMPPGPQALKVRKPDGAEVEVAAGGKFNQTDSPGVYAVTPGTLRFVVNLAPDESRTAPLSEERLASLRLPLKKSATETTAASVQHQARAQAAELEGQQKLWRWLIVAALVVLLIETWLGGRLTRVARAETT